MIIQHSVNAQARSSQRSTLRRFLSAAAAGALLLGVASASADGGHGGPGDRGNGGGVFVLSTIAGVGDSYTGKLDVKGDGRFKVRDAGPNLIFSSHVTEGELNMKDGRQKHTVGEDSKLNLKGGAKVKLIVDKSKLTFPEAGKESSGKAPGKLVVTIRKDGKDVVQGQEENVTVSYTVKEDGGKYTIEKATFDFDYTKHTPDGKKVCLMLVCVKPTVSITATKGTIEASK